MKYNHKCPTCQQVWGHANCSSGGLVTLGETWGVSRENQTCLPCAEKHYPKVACMRKTLIWKYQEDPFVTWTKKVRKNDNKTRAAGK